MESVSFRTAYDVYNGKRHRVSLAFLDEFGEQAVGKTEQAHKTTCDILNIILRYDTTGLITHVNQAIADYGDYTEINEYQEALNLVNRAKDSFLEVPSDVRKRFGNDPGAFFEFATNPANAGELVSMGLAHPPLSSSIPDVGDSTPSEPTTGDS